MPSPPPPRGKGGDFPISPSGIARAIKRWVELADIRDAQGQRPRAFPHAFRHRLGTSMVNADVPLQVVQRMLDHSSLEMTAHYARILDSSLRREWEKWQQRVNIRGELAAEGSSSRRPADSGNGCSVAVAWNPCGWPSSSRASRSCPTSAWVSSPARRAGRRSSRWSSPCWTGRPRRATSTTRRCCSTSAAPRTRMRRRGCSAVTRSR